MICINCNTDIPDGTRYCPECGVDNVSPTAKEGEGTRDELVKTNLVYPRNPPHSPYFCFLSIIPGLAHVFFGQVSKGITIFIASSLLSLIILIIFPPLGWIIWIIITIDSYKVGKKLASGLPVRKWEWFPKSQSKR